MSEKVDYIEAVVRTGFDSVSPQILQGAQLEYYTRCRSAFLQFMTYAGAEVAVDEPMCDATRGLFTCEVSHHSLEGGRKKFTRWLRLNDKLVRYSLEGCKDENPTPEEMRSLLYLSIDREAAREVRDVSVDCYNHFYHALEGGARMLFLSNPYPA